MVQGGNRQTTAMHETPGQSPRRGLTLIRFPDMFPTGKAAPRWLEARVSPKGRRCGQHRMRRSLSLLDLHDEAAHGRVQ